MSYEPTTKEQHERLIETGHTYEGGNDYTRKKENGSYERVETDGDWRRSSENNWQWERN